jgi:hypothetical protein
MNYIINFLLGSIHPLQRPMNIRRALTHFVTKPKPNSQPLSPAALCYIRTALLSPRDRWNHPFPSTSHGQAAVSTLLPTRRRCVAARWWVDLAPALIFRRGTTRAATSDPIRSDLTFVFGSHGQEIRGRDGASDRRQGIPTRTIFFLSYAYAIWYVSFPPFFIGLDWAKQSGNRLDSTIVWKYCFNQTGDSGYEGGVVVGTDRKL